jgi:predicted MPP superfamily phosphohydrolase
MLSYFLIASLLTLLTHGYFALRLLPALAAGTRGRRWVFWLLLGNCALLPGTMVLTLYATPAAAPWAVPLAHVAFADVGFCILLGAGLGVRDAAWACGALLASGAGWLARRLGGRSSGSVPLVTPARRRLLLGGLNVVACGAAGAATAVGYGIALAQPVLRRVRLPCAGLPPDFPALRIAQISDLHVGPTLRRGYVEKLVQTVNALGADLVVITGDLVDGSVSQLGEQVAPLAALRARHGVYFVTGNHEYFYRGAQWCAALRALGLRVLEDQHQLIEHEGTKVLLIGLNDLEAAPEAPRAAVLAGLLAQAPPAALRILLAHRPSDVQLTAGLAIDVQLSGHLHGGQFFPLTLLVKWAEPFLAGLYRVGDLWLYVNRGAGYWGPPNRLGVRQELTLLELVRA